MGGMSALTGKYIDDVAGDGQRSHVTQSIRDILMTPIGSRVLEKEYGSKLFDLIDRPITNTIEIYTAVVEAIERWEPRYKVSSVNIDIKERSEPSKIDIVIDGYYVPLNTEYKIKVSL